MTERGRGAPRSAMRPSWQIGAECAATGTGRRWTIDIERGDRMPLPSQHPGHGAACIPAALTGTAVRPGHRRGGIAGGRSRRAARVEVALEQPGPALERGRLLRHQRRRRSRWKTPSRPGTGAAGNTGRGASILYDVERRGGPPLALALEVDRTGAVERFDPLPVATLPATRWWRIGRADAGGRRAPGHGGRDAGGRAVLRPLGAEHADRRASRSRRCTRACRSTASAPRWVQALLPFRMPRVP